MSGDKDDQLVIKSSDITRAEVFAMTLRATQNPGLAYKKAFVPNSTASPNKYSLKAYEYMECNPNLHKVMDKVKKAYRQASSKDRSDLLADVQHVYSLALKNKKFDTALNAIKMYAQLGGHMGMDPKPQKTPVVEINIVDNGDGKKEKWISNTPKQNTTKKSVGADPYVLGKIDN